MINRFPKRSVEASLTVRYGGGSRPASLHEYRHHFVTSSAISPKFSNHLAAKDRDYEIYAANLGLTPAHEGEPDVAAG